MTLGFLPAPLPERQSECQIESQPFMHSSGCPKWRLHLPTPKRKKLPVSYYFLLPALPPNPFLYNRDKMELENKLPSSTKPFPYSSSFPILFFFFNIDLGELQRSVHIRGLYDNICLANCWEGPTSPPPGAELSGTQGRHYMEKKSIFTHSEITANLPNPLV